MEQAILSKKSSHEWGTKKAMQGKVLSTVSPAGDTFVHDHKVESNHLK